MKKLLLFVFTATLVLFFTTNMFAQQFGKTVKVANNNELLKALGNSNVESIKVIESGFYDALLMTVNEGTTIFKGKIGGDGSRAACTYWILDNNVCFDGDTTQSVAVSGVNSAPGPGGPCPTANKGYWTVVSKPATATLTFMDPVNMDIMHFYVDQPGVYELNNSWYSTPGDPNSTLLGSAQTLYYFYSSPTITNLDAVPDTVCGLSTTINYAFDMGVQPANDTIVKWTVNGADSSAVYPSTGSGSFTFQAGACGAYQVILSVTNSYGCTEALDTLNIYFRDVPVANAGTDASVCGLVYGGLNGTYTVNCDAGEPINQSWSKFDGPGNATFTADLDSVTVDVCGTYTFVYHAQNGSSCEGTDTLVIKFYDTPVVTAHPTDTIKVCGLDAALNPNFSVNCANGGTVGTAWSGASLTFNGNTATADYCGTYTAYYTVTNGPCTATDSVVIEYYDTPNVTANDGADTVEVCENGVKLLPLVTASCTNSGSLNSTWSGAGLSFVGDSAYAASCGTYTAILTVTNGPCTAVDSVLLKFYDTPVVDAGAGDTLCATGAQLVATHTEQCTNGTPVTVKWTKVSGPGHVVFNPDDNETTDVTVDACGEYQFKFEVTNGPCTNFDTVSYFFTDTPDITKLTFADTVCGFNVNGNAAYTVGCALNDTGILTGPTGVTIVFTAPDSYDIQVPTCGTYNFTYTVTNGPCSKDSTFKITFFSTPDPTVVGEDTVFTCSTTTYTVADPGCNDPNGITYQWNVVGGVFAGGATTATTASVDVTWGQNPGAASLSVKTSVNGIDCEGNDTLTIFKHEPTLEGQVKYWNSVETYMPSPYATNDYCTIPFDYFYVILAVDQGNGPVDLDTAYVQPRLMEDLNELMSYFNFNLITGQYGCDAKYYLRIWDGGFVYHTTPPAPAENTTLGNNYTYNNWGGVNATDALAIQLMAANVQVNAAPYNYAWVGTNTWSPSYGYYSQGIADVNHTFGNTNIVSGITALDALTAKYRAVGLLGSYPDNSNANTNQFRPNFMVTGRMVPSLPYVTFPAPFDSTHVNDVPFTHSGNEYMYFQPATNHKYTSDTLPWSGKNNYINLYYEAVGDVNASYIPPGSGLKAKSALELEYRGLASSAVGSVMTIPVSVDRDINDVGAVTLSFNYRNDLIEVLGTNYSDDDMFINQEEGVLNIGWFSTDGVDFNADATVAQIRVKVLAEIPAGTELFQLNSISELADVNAQPISDITLKTIGVTTDKGIINTTELTTSNYPNPFADQTTISYTLPENGKVKVEVYNSVGMLVKTLVDEYQESGVQNVVFTATAANKSGVYVYRITVQGETNNYTAVKRMIVVH